MSPSRLPGSLKGFTLLEILVVMVILGVLVGFAVLRVGGADPAEQAERQMRALAALVEARCEQSLLQSRSLGIRILPDGYDFWEPHDGEWIPEATTEGPFRARRFTVQTDLVLTVDGHEVPVGEDVPLPQIRCLPEGELTPFVLESEAAGRTLARLQGRGNGRLDLVLSP